MDTHEQTNRTSTNVTSSSHPDRPESTTQSEQDTKNSAKEAADKAREQAESTKAQTQQKASEVAAQAKEKASEYTEKARREAESRAEEQKERAASGLESVASGLRSAGQDFREEDVDMVGQYADAAANQIDEFSQYLRSRDTSDLLGEVERFARRQPEIFLAGALAGGFLLGRFLKSSSRRQTDFNRGEYGRQRSAAPRYNRYAPARYSDRPYQQPTTTQQVGQESQQYPPSSRGYGTYAETNTGSREYDTYPEADTGSETNTGR